MAFLASPSIAFAFVPPSVTPSIAVLAGDGLEVLFDVKVHGGRMPL